MYVKFLESVLSTSNLTLTLDDSEMLEETRLLNHELILEIGPIYVCSDNFYYDLTINKCIEATNIIDLYLFKTEYSNLFNIKINPHSKTNEAIINHLKESPKSYFRIELHDSSLNTYTSYSIFYDEEEKEFYVKF